MLLSDILRIANYRKAKVHINGEKPKNLNESYSPLNEAYNGSKLLSSFSAQLSDKDAEKDEFSLYDFTNYFRDMWINLLGCSEFELTEKKFEALRKAYNKSRDKDRYRKDRPDINRLIGFAVGFTSHIAFDKVSDADFDILMPDKVKSKKYKDSIMFWTTNDSDILEEVKQRPVVFAMTFKNKVLVVRSAYSKIAFWPKKEPYVLEADDYAASHGSYTSLYYKISDFISNALKSKESWCWTYVLGETKYAKTAKYGKFADLLKYPNADKIYALDINKLKDNYVDKEKNAQREEWMEYKKHDASDPLNALKINKNKIKSILFVAHSEKTQKTLETLDLITDIITSISDKAMQFNELITDTYDLSTSMLQKPLVLNDREKELLRLYQDPIYAFGRRASEKQDEMVRFYTNMLDNMVSKCLEMSQYILNIKLNYAELSKYQDSFDKEDFRSTQNISQVLDKIKNEKESIQHIGKILIGLKNDAVNCYSWYKNPNADQSMKDLWDSIADNFNSLKKLTDNV